MKGKVRVYCRIRPFSNSEKENAERYIACYDIHDEFTLTVGKSTRSKDYTFDTVFGPEST